MNIYYSNIIFILSKSLIMLLKKEKKETSKQPKIKKVKDKKPKDKKVKVKKVKEPKVKHHRNRFSVLEVVSIIAVLSIVVSVGVLFYNNHFKKVIPETDKELVNQLNQSVSKHFGSTKKDLELKDVIEKIEEDGIIFSRLSFANKDVELVFDDSVNTFGLLEKDVGVSYPVEIERKMKAITPNVWRFIEKSTGDLEHPFSYYLMDGFSGGITVIGGVDVGHNDDVNRISYTNVTNKRQTVKLKTNSFETEVIVTEDIGDTVNHYGRCGKFTAKRLHTDSYHEYGDCKYAYVNSGRVVAEGGGNIDVAYVTSEVAFLQENGGKINRAFASTSRISKSSKTKDEKYGNKKALEYDETITQQANESRAISIGEASVNSSIVEERIERGLEKHPTAIGYTKEGSTITVFDSYQDAVNHFDEFTDGLVTVTGSENLQEKLVISNKNIIFRGDEFKKSTIRGNIEISHTSGNHNIIFENIRFESSSSEAHTIVDHSEAVAGRSGNNLEFHNLFIKATIQQMLHLLH